jgi:YHS domain-containing protein
VMLSGTDVVAYFTEGAVRAGSASLKSEFKGVAFYFSKPEHKALFDAAPEKYIPQFGGFCANGIVYSIPWGGQPDAWRIVDGKLYIFGGAGSRDAFLLDTKANIALAERYWKEEVSGSNAFIQRNKRVMFRVPHYKTSAELSEALARSRAGPATAPAATPTQK